VYGGGYSKYSLAFVDSNFLILGCAKLDLLQMTNVENFGSIQVVCTTSLCVSKMYNCVILGHGDGAISILTNLFGNKATTFTLTKQLKSVHGGKEIASLSTYQSLLVSGSYDGVAKIFELPLLSPICEFTHGPSKKRLLLVKFHPGGGWLVTAGHSAGTALDEQKTTSKQ
jgi:WD40 repeat protein